MILLQSKDTTIIVIFTEDWEQQLLSKHTSGKDFSWDWSPPDKSQCHREAVLEMQDGHCSGVIARSI